MGVRADRQEMRPHLPLADACQDGIEVALIHLVCPRRRVDVAHAHALFITPAELGFALRGHDRAASGPEREGSATRRVIDTDGRSPEARRRRDERDRNRAVAPLVPADDARVIDTSALDREEAIAAAIEAVDLAMR